MPSANPSYSGGMFQDPTNFMPNVRGPQPYDISGIYKGMDVLNRSPGYQKNSYSPYQFKMPEESFKNAYTQAMNVATRPVMAQGKERMRQLGQGFEGGRLGGAAGAELALKSAMQTGSDLQDTSKGIGSSMAAARLNLENTMQRDQADENFRSAGFSDSQSRYMSEDAINRARMFADIGATLPRVQGELTDLESRRYGDILGKLGGLYGPIGQ